jgi:hypothetical protein
VNELLSDAKTVVLGLLGLLMTLFAFIGRRHLKEFDELKRNAVSRAEVERMHEENRDKLDAIDETVTATHRRIDEMYRDMINKR